MEQQDVFKKISIPAILGILGILAIVIIWPIFTAILAGLILAYIFYPLYLRVLAIVKERNTSAIIIILLVFIIIFVPLWFLLPIVTKQVFDIYLFLQNVDFFHLLSKALPSLADLSVSKDIAFSLNKLITNVASAIVSSSSNIIFNLPTILLKLVVTLFVFFFGMRDAKLLTSYIVSLSPFSKKTEKELAKKFNDITGSVIKGYLILGLLQGILTGIGLIIFGVPGGLILTIVAIFASIIPVLGAWAVWLPASIYLLAVGKEVYGIILFLYGAIFVSWIDNVLRPYIVSRKAKISSGVILVGMIGGLIVFGVFGLVLGPLILAYLLLILDAYRKNKFSSLFR
ncbi:MAG: AI-2E family transporter [Candidatus Pacearchaeota archaeon]|nr:AI-2E family transporter [Candidatus Pacearchaeota archaeon]